MSKKKKVKELWVGLIHLEMFKVTVPVFTNDFDRVKSVRSLGYKTTRVEDAFAGYVSLAFDKDQDWLISMIVPLDASLNTLVHESCHVVDLVFRQLGIDPGFESMETRAYMLGYVTDELYKILREANDAEAELARILH